ncbi:hypothetical protein BDK51DRAFT_48895 [Blyttiomyces helicus]|uniref:Uncharacterized protein n=1 Tax=Blyttiomyces helicus TaxID=388810 RepID=A0A4P9W378_9FUNG|nr:hypothetical protein BDK51DRAFT_48895 [Blyttiomyces helicus]|eukprot:RKO84556.1 hypothetical protein BDK51DRAFT_48895 [Blyttiomyces helicus]
MEAVNSEILELKQEGNSRLTKVKRYFEELRYQLPFVPIFQEQEAEIRLLKSKIKAGNERTRREQDALRQTREELTNRLHQLEAASVTGKQTAITAIKGRLGSVSLSQGDVEARLQGATSNSLSAKLAAAEERIAGLEKKLQRVHAIAKSVALVTSVAAAGSADPAQELRVLQEKMQALASIFDDPPDPVPSEVSAPKIGVIPRIMDAEKRLAALNQTVQGALFPVSAARPPPLDEPQTLASSSAAPGGPEFKKHLEELEKKLRDVQQDVVDARETPARVLVRSVRGGYLGAGCGLKVEDVLAATVVQRMNAQLDTTKNDLGTLREVANPGIEAGPNAPHRFLSQTGTDGLGVYVGAKMTTHLNGILDLWKKNWYVTSEILTPGVDQHLARLATLKANVDRSLSKVVPPPVASSTSHPASPAKRKELEEDSSEGVERQTRRKLDQGETEGQMDCS